MALDPRTLESIRNPTGGRLGQIGQTLAQNRQRAIENEQNRELMEMKREAFDFTKDKANREKYDFASKVSGAYADSMIEWEKNNPNASDEDFYAAQSNYRNNLSESEREFVKEGFQTIGQINQSKTRADDIQFRLHGDDKKAKSSFDLVTLQDPDDPEHILSYHKDDKDEVKKKLDEGWTVRKTGQTINIGAGATAYEKERGKQQAAQIGEIEKSAKSAYDNIVSLQRFKKASVKGYQGSLAPIVAGARNLVASFGYESEKLKDVNFMQQSISEILEQKMEQLGARGLTDEDMKILRRVLPRVETDKASRDAVADILIKAHEKDIEGYNFAIKEEKRLYPNIKVRKPSWLNTYQENKGNQEIFGKADAIIQEP